MAHKNHVSVFDVCEDRETVQDTGGIYIIFLETQLTGRWHKFCSQFWSWPEFAIAYKVEEFGNCLVLFF